MADTRKLLKLSIVFFFVLAVFFFACIFLLTDAHNVNLKNKIALQVPIKQQEISTWGQVPGELMYSWSRSYMPYQLQYNPTVDAPLIKLKTTSNYTFDVVRTFENATWYPQKSVVSYNTNYTLDSDQAQEEDTSYKMINLGAYDVWYQMANKPKYFKAWQAISLAYELMLNSDYVNRLYAWNVLNFYFKDEASVNKNVLTTLSATDQHTVYTDKNYGLNNLKGLAVWCAAGVGISGWETSAPAKEAQAYFESKGITLSATQMTLIVGNGSMLRQIMIQVLYAATYVPDLQLHSTVTIPATISAQWGSTLLTTGESINMAGVTPPASIKDLNDELTAAPEFGAFVLDPTKGKSDTSNTLDVSGAKKDFTRDVSNFRTFLNLDSMKTFYDAYDTHDYSLMDNRFSLTNWDQVELMHGYFDDIIENLLLKGGDYRVVALSQIMNKHTTNTLGYLSASLPNDLTTRVLAGKIKAAGTDCAYYWKEAMVEEAKATEICDGVDFTDPQTLKFYINATWYGDPYSTELMTQTGVTQMNFALFFYTDYTTQPTQFGALLVQTLTEIAGQYGCASYPPATGLFANCTGEELGSLQWGSLGVTQNPKSDWDATYVPVADTVAGWAGQPTWEPYGSWDPATGYIEYPQCTASQKQYWTTLPQATAAKFLTTDPADGSLASLYGWTSFLMPYYLDQTEQVQTYLTLFDWSKEDLSTFIANMRAYVQSRIFDSAYAEYTMTQLLTGFENPYAARLNGGHYAQGDDFSLSNYTTPILNDQTGFGKNVSFGLYTGSNGDDEIGLLRLINGQAYANKVTTIYNGTKHVNVTQSDPKSSIDMQKLDEVSNGIQFPPYIETDDQLKAYDQRNIKITTYTHSKSQTLGGNDLQLEKYTAASHGDDVGFAYNQDVFEKPVGCFQCYQNVSEFKSVQVDDQPYAISTTPSDNFLIVQPNSGQMYQIRKQSTVYMLIGGNTTVSSLLATATPFPELDVIYGQPFPFYEFTENISADDKAFLHKLDYIGIIGKAVDAIVIAFSILASVALLLAIVAIVLYKCKDPKRRNQDEERLVDAPTEA